MDFGWFLDRFSMDFGRVWGAKLDEERFPNRQNLYPKKKVTPKKVASKKVAPQKVEAGRRPAFGQKK